MQGVPVTPIAFLQQCRTRAAIAAIVPTTGASDNNTDCPICRYLRFMGLGGVRVSGSGYATYVTPGGCWQRIDLGDGVRAFVEQWDRGVRQFPAPINDMPDILVGDRVVPNPKTFGACTERTKNRLGTVVSARTLQRTGCVSVKWDGVKYDKQIHWSLLAVRGRSVRT